jgi:hypothetical protein
MDETCQREINKLFRNDPELTREYELALLERTADASEKVAAATEPMTGIDPGIDLDGYSNLLIEKECNGFQLAVLHPIAEDFDRRLVLWSVFVEPSAEMRAIVSSQTQLERLLCVAGRGWLAMAARVVTAAPYGC